MLTELILTNKARQAIAKARSVDEVKDIRDKAEAVRLYAKRAGLGRDMENDAAEIVIRAERRMGEILQTIGRSPGGRPSKNSSQVATSLQEALDGAGVSRQQASQVGMLAEMPEVELDTLINDARKDGGISPHKAHKAARDHRRKKKRIEQAEETQPNPLAQIELADARAWLEEQEPCDLLITDPPYSTDVADIDKFAEWLPLALSKIKPTGRAYVFIGAYPAELRAYLNVALPEQVLVWEYRNTIGPKPNGVYKLNWQAILYYVGPDAPPLNCESLLEQFSVQNVNAPDARHETRYHAWEKPMALAEMLVRHACKPGDSILDPYAGTGTFLLAGAAHGCEARGCDNDPPQIAIAQERGAIVNG